MLDSCVITSSAPSDSLSRPHDDLAETMQRSHEVHAAGAGSPSKFQGGVMVVSVPWRLGHEPEASALVAQDVSR